MKEVAALGVLGEVRGQGALSCVEFVEEMETKEIILQTPETLGKELKNGF